MTQPSESSARTGSDRGGGVHIEDQARTDATSLHHGLDEFALLAAAVAAMNSASSELCATMECALAPAEMRTPSKKATHELMDLRLRRSPVQSESLKTAISGSSRRNACNESSSSAAPLR